MSAVRLKFVRLFIAAIVLLYGYLDTKRDSLAVGAIGLTVRLIRARRDSSNLSSFGNRHH